MTSLILEFTTTAGVETLEYQLADNDIAKRWIRKIYHLQRVPLDRNTTSSETSYQPYDQYKNQLDQIIDWINLTTDHSITKQNFYNQFDLCQLHDIYLLMAKDPRYDIFENTYKFNTLIHKCEHALRQDQLEVFNVSWGAQEGLLVEQFKEDPYQYYTSNVKAGNLYLYWAEQGKTPWDYYCAKDPDNLEHFLKTTIPHRQFSGFFKIQISDRGKSSNEFWIWFEKYKTEFLKKWNLSDWSRINEDGAIELATLTDPIDQFNSIKSNFVQLNCLYLK